MADRAPLTHCLVFVDERAALLCMTLEAGFVSSHESEAAGCEFLLHVGRCALGCDALVRLMAIAAAHLAFWHRMVVREGERCANIQVALETSVRRFPRIDDRPSATAGLHVQTPRSVTRLATHVLCVFAFCFQSRVGGCAEVAYDLFVAGRAFF